MSEEPKKRVVKVKVKMKRSEFFARLRDAVASVPCKPKPGQSKNSK